MRIHTVFLFVLAIGAAGLTAYVARSWVLATERRSAGPGEIQLEQLVTGSSVSRPTAIAHVLVAGTDLPTGTILRRDHLEWHPWPEEAIDPRYALDGAVEVDDYLGSVARTAIAAREPIVESRLVRLGDSGFLAAILEPGMRAVTVPIDAASGVAGLIMPGDRVDVIVTHEIGRDDRQNTRRASETVLSNVRVLALDQRLDDLSRESGLAKTATLELRPKQAEIMAMTTELGRVSLSLRSLPLDVQASAEVAAGPHRRRSFTTDTEVSSLLMPLADEETGPSVTIVRGNAAEELNFKAP